MFELTGEDISLLGDEALRALVVRLCEAELRQTNHPVSAVLAGGNQTAPDGGVDVAVRLDKLTSRLDFIPRAHTDFQVKCTDMPKAKIEEEMTPNGVLRQSIRDLIVEEGAYVIVSSHGSVAHGPLKARLEAMKYAIALEPGASSLLVDFYDRDRLARWTRQFPGVEMWVRDEINHQHKGWSGYREWAEGDQSLRYVHDDNARLRERKGGGPPVSLSIPAGLDRLRDLLLLPGQIARLVGLSGTGKTRFVQALFEDGIGVSAPLDKAIVLYTDLGDEPEPSAREMLARLGVTNQRAIVIVDNCNPATHATLSRQVAQVAKQTSLLTIEYDVTDEGHPESTDVFELSSASNSVVTRILERLAPLLEHFDRTRIAEFSGGNARIALALARTIGKGESVGALNDDDLFRRLFSQTQAVNDDLLRAAQVCSLVYSFDGKDVASADSQMAVLGSLAEMTPATLFRHIVELQRRDLIQSRSKWRALLPPALANRLAKGALKSIHSNFVIDAFQSNDWLIRSFSRRIQFLHDSSEAKSIAVQWLNDDAWFFDPIELSSNQRTLLFNIAPVAPVAVLDNLERTLRKHGAKVFIEKQSDAKSEWSALIRHLSYESQSFERAATLLLELAEADEDSNDFQNDLKELFRIGLSGTRATPHQREQFVRQAMLVATGRRLALLKDAVEAMLEMHSFSSSHDFSFGARTDGFGWEPSSTDDQKTWLQLAFGLVKLMATSGDAGLEIAKEMVARNFRGLWFSGDLDVLVSAMLELGGGESWPAGWIAVKTTITYDKNSMPPHILGRLEELAQKLSPQNLVEEIRTYVLGHANGLLDVADVDGEETSEGKTPWARVEAKAVALGREAALQPKVLQSILPEIFSATYGKQGLFAQGLGEATKDPIQDWRSLVAVFAVAPCCDALAGYLRGLRTGDQATADLILNDVELNPELDKYYPYFMGVPRNDADGNKLLASICRGNADTRQYMLRTAYGGEHGLSIQKFCELINEILKLDGGLDHAISELSSELFGRRNSKSAVPGEIMKVGIVLLGRLELPAQRQALSFQVKEVAKVVLSDPGSQIVAQKLGDYLAASLEGLSMISGDYGEIAELLFKWHPLIALDTLLGRPTQRKFLGRGRRIAARQGPAILAAAPAAVLAWVQLDPDFRAPIIAMQIPIVGQAADGSGDLTALASQLLMLATNKNQILSAFSSHFNPVYWAGHLNDYLKPSLEMLEKLKSHTNIEVINWANRTIDQLDARISSDRATTHEEEESFE